MSSESDEPRGVRARIAAGIARTEEPGAVVWPGPVAGLVAGAWAAAMSLLSIAFVVVLAWIFAPLGGGQFSDAARMATGLWLLADGGEVHWQGAVLSLPPLLLTLVIILFQRRAGRWLVAAANADDVRAALPACCFAILAAVSAHVVLTQLVLVDGVTAPVAHNALGSLVVALVGFGWGMQRELLPEWPTLLTVIVRAVATFVAVLLAGSVATLLVLTVVRHASFMDVLTAVAGDRTSTVQLLLACAAYLPTLLLWALAALVGPGFMLGLGTQVTLQTVIVGALPPIPLLALLPAQAPSWAPSLVVVPALASAVATWRIRRERSVAVSLLVVAATVLAGALLGLAAHGGIGPGRLASTGAAPAHLALAMAGWMAAALLLRWGWHAVRVWQSSRSVAAQGQPETQESAE